MTKLNPRPVIFALSNPTEHAECTAEEAYNWSGARRSMLPACSFRPLNWAARPICHAANNVYIFPSICLAVYATESKRVPMSYS